MITIITTSNHHYPLLITIKHLSTLVPFFWENSQRGAMLTAMSSQPTWVTHVEVSKNGGTPRAGWFIMEHPIKIDALGVALF